MANDKSVAEQLLDEDDAQFNEHEGSGSAFATSGRAYTEAQASRQNAEPSEAPPVPVYSPRTPYVAFCSARIVHENVQDDTVLYYVIPCNTPDGDDLALISSPECRTSILAVAPFSAQAVLDFVFDNRRLPKQ